MPERLVLQAVPRRPPRLPCRPDPGDDDLARDRDEPWPLAGQELARLRGGFGSGPGQLRSPAGARGEGEDVADGGFLAGRFGQRQVHPAGDRVARGQAPPGAWANLGPASSGLPAPMLDDRVGAGEHQGGVAVIESHQVGRLPARSADPDDLALPARMADDIGVHVEPVPYCCLHAPTSSSAMARGVPAFPALPARRRTRSRCTQTGTGKQPPGRWWWFRPCAAFASGSLAQLPHPGPRRTVPCWPGQWQGASPLEFGVDPGAGLGPGGPATGPPEPGGHPGDS